MRQLQNSKGRTLCFPRHITEAVNKIFDYPLVILEAPMGYGKTTAVREYVILTSANLLWQNVYDDSKAAFWGGFCFLFKELDSNRAHSLMQLGFPNDSVSMHAALTLIKNIALPGQTIIVIDDYHLVDTQEVTSFITLLAVNEIKNLHVVLISRFFEFFNTEELSLKSYLYHIKKESFEFNREEIINYYKYSGINLTEDKADELYKLTEGWISALYLLILNFKESGNLLTPLNIYKLIEQAVYNPFSDQIKSFLLSMSIYNNFTPEQAAYMTSGDRIEDIINEVTGKNAFVMYDPIEKTYHIHSIFKNFLLNKLKSMGESFQTELYKKAAGWYLQIGDYLLSMRYSVLGGDFDTLLGSLELDKGQSINGERRDLLIKYFDDCSLEDKIKHPYAVLIYARRMFMFNEISLFKRCCEIFMTICQHIGAGNDAYKNKLLGEYELLMSLTEYNDIEKMAEYHKAAYIFLKEPSFILDKQSIWTYGSPSILFLFYRKSGELSKEIQILREIMPYYCQITGNHGKGAGELMSAERFYYMGDFENAEIAMHSAYQAAAETSDIMICTILLDIKLRFVKGDLAGILVLFERLYNNIYEKQWSMFTHMTDICEAYVYSRLNMTEKVEPWIKSGEFQSTLLLSPSLAYLNIVYGKYLLENKEYLMLLGRAEEFLSTARVYPNLLAQIYTYIFIAAASVKLSREDDALSALVRALDIAMPDQLYMPFADSGDAIKPLLEELRTNNIYTDDITKILVLYKCYHEASERMIRENSAQGKAVLTERENEIACLAAQCLSNKAIGKRLYISENTVKTQLKSVFVKLGVNSRALLKQRLEE